MKVLQINAVHRQLSTGRNMAQLNDFFTQQGHTAIAAYSVGAVQDPQRDYIIGGRMGQKLHALLSRITGLQGYYSRIATRKFLRETDRISPDVVILNNLHANYIHLPMLLRYLAKNDIPTVAVLHDCWFYTGKCCHYTVSGCYRWQKQCGSCPAKKMYNSSWLFDRSPKMLRDKKAGFGAIPRLGVVTVSDWLLGEAKKAPVLQNAKAIQRIYNWIDTEKFAPLDTVQLRTEMGLQKKRVILCVAGIWDSTKGLNTALELARGLEPDTQMVLVGKLPAGTVLPEQVTHVPKTDNVDELVALYSMADVFFQPSMEETFGKVSAEALSCGTPVVCFRSTANPELIGPGCGVVAEPGDLDGACAAMDTIFARGKEAYKEACRSFAVENFAQEKNCKEYLEFCARLIAM